MCASVDKPDEVEALVYAAERPANRLRRSR
jgi:hypothetical protein